MTNDPPLGKPQFPETRHQPMKSALPGEPGGRMIISYEITGKPELLRGVGLHFVSRRGFDLSELRKRAQAGGFWLTRAANAGNGEERENRSDKCGKNADHGSVRFY